MGWNRSIQNHPSFTFHPRYIKKTTQILLKHCKPKRKDTIPFSLTSSQVLPNIKEITNKHWRILSIDSSFKAILNNLQPMIAFPKNTSVKKLIGTNTIRKNKKFITPTQTKTTDQCIARYTSRSLCCKLSKHSHLQALKPVKPLQSFTKSLAIVTVSSTY